MINHPIESAPKNGQLIYVLNPTHDVRLLAQWNPSRLQWEGKTFGLMGFVDVVWDKHSDIQPTHWHFRA